VEQYGFSRDEFLRMSIFDIRPEAEAQKLLENLKQVQTGVRGEVWRHRTKYGADMDVEVNSQSLVFGGRPARLVHAHDVTERNRVALANRQLEEKYRRLVRDSPDGITWTAPDGRFLAVNPAFVEMLGYDSEAELLALNASALYPTPEERAALVRKIADTGRVSREEIHLKRKDGSIITALCTARFVTDSVTGEQHLEAVSEDVTDQRRVEQQFRQAQKMDAVGQLAGGVAHDFNNLLTVILSYSHFLLSSLAPDDPNREDVDAIRSAGESAAALTRQLLVFSRQQVVQPKVLRLNEVVAGTGKMLRRLIGENIELATTLDPDAGAVKVDAGQMEQVIVNLAVNARDAMPNGGRLLIESKNAEFHEAVTERTTLYPAGRYVMLAVSDNGIGMDAATQAKVFEPFFTTKAVGKGTGLGLATVYGIVKQSGGDISLYSEPGAGTSFKIYFPRVDGTAIGAGELAPAAALPRGRETIMIADDDPAVRNLVRQVLERQGYRVLEAPDGESALDVAARHTDSIQLLITDLVMPRMTGRALSERFAALRPDVRVLFVSGYTDDAIVHHGVLDGDMEYLQKPFTPDALARKVRSVLDMAAAQPGGSAQD
jgi:two-component system cell cycle sensor histidine kinase/response regulator CckA